MDAENRRGKFRALVFPAGLDRAEIEEAEARAQHPAGAEQGVTRRIGVDRDAEQAGQLRRTRDQFAHDRRHARASAGAHAGERGLRHDPMRWVDYYPDRREAQPVGRCEPRNDMRFHIDCHRAGLDVHLPFGVGIRDRGVDANDGRVAGTRDDLQYFFRPDLIGRVNLLGVDDR